MTDPERGKRSGRLLIALTLGWVAIFSYLLLTSDPPDLGPIKLRSFEDSGHLLGSLLLGFLAFLVLRRQMSRAGRAALFSLGATLTLLIGLEFAQELRPGRGYQRIDVELNFVGSAAGVALAWAIHSIVAYIRKRPDQPAGAKGDPAP